MQAGGRTRWAVCSACSWKKCLQRLIELLFISCLFHVWVRSSFPLTYTWGPTSVSHVFTDWGQIEIVALRRPGVYIGRQRSERRWMEHTLPFKKLTRCLFFVFFSFQHQQRVWVAAWTGSHTRISHSWPKWVLALKWWPTRHSANWGPLLSFGPLD